MTRLLLGLVVGLLATAGSAHADALYPGIGSSSSFSDGSKGTSVWAGRTPSGFGTQAAARYFTPQANIAGSASEVLTQQVVATPGTIDQLRCKAVIAPGAAPAQWVYAVRVNAATSAITCTMTGAATTTCSDTTNSVAVVAGDLVNFIATPSDTPADTQIGCSFRFKAN